MENIAEKFDIVKGVDGGRAKAQCRTCGRTVAKNVGTMRLHFKMAHGNGGAGRRGKATNATAKTAAAAAPAAPRHAKSFVKMKIGSNGALEPLEPLESLPPAPLSPHSIAAAKTRILNPKLAEIEKLIREDANELSAPQAVKRGKCEATVARGTLRRQKLQRLAENVNASSPAALQGQLVDVMKTVANAKAEQPVAATDSTAVAAAQPQQTVSHPIDIADLRMSSKNKNAARIGELLAKNSDVIGHSDHDELVIDGQALPGTNYVSVLRGLFYGQQLPKGVSKLVARLKDVGATSKMITNPTARVLFEQSGNGLQPPGRRIEFIHVY